MIEYIIAIAFMIIGILYIAGAIIYMDKESHKDILR